GITGMVVLANPYGDMDHESAIASFREKTRNLLIEVEVAGCLTKGGEGRQLAAMGGMKAAGVAFLTDGDVAVENAQLLRRAIEYAQNFDLLIATHADTPSLSCRGVMNEGKVAYQLGLSGKPALSEEIAVERDVRIAHYVGARLHLRGLSSAGSLRVLRRAREEGAEVTCEVFPQHLLFDEGQIGETYDTLYKVNPPLRTAEDRQALIEALRKGWIDVIASDHLPCSRYAKQTDFESAPEGMSGLETTLVALHHHLIRSGELRWEDLVRSYSQAPRTLLNQKAVTLEEGSSADFVIFDPGMTTHFQEETYASRGRNCPFLGQELEGGVDEVIFRGESVWKR
ncbi:MAG: dihydroorotase, partial [Verrucomicrobiota bacterium]